MTVVVVTAKKVVNTGQKTRAFTVSSGMSRGTRGGNGASALQVVRFFPQRACLAERQHTDDEEKRDPGEDHPTQQDK